MNIYILNEPYTYIVTLLLLGARYCYFVFVLRMTYMNEIKVNLEKLLRFTHIQQIDSFRLRLIFLLLSLFVYVRKLLCVYVILW